jgi:uncharacterized protein YxjI
MNSVLNRNAFFVKEHVGMFKAANNYDVLDPESGLVVLECREPKLGFFTKWFRFTKYKRYTPFAIEVRDSVGAPVVFVRRGVSFIRSVVGVFDAAENPIGTFRQKLLSIGGKFDILDAEGRSRCTLAGSWTSWEFRFERDGAEIARVSKKWAGIGRELFTSADNYMLTIDPSVPADDPDRVLIVAAVFCIDMVLKE